VIIISADDFHHYLANSPDEGKRPSSGQAIHWRRAGRGLPHMEGLMANLLFVTSSVFGPGSKSRLIGGEFVAGWVKAHPGTVVVERNLTAEAMPHLTQETIAAWSAPAERRTGRERELAGFADALIAEVEAADVIVIAAPMYNFAISSTLKAWIDHLARAGRTFRYTAAGPEGLLKGKKVFVVTGRGGVYSGESPARGMDFQEPYLRGMLGFLGFDDVTFIHVEGLAISAEAAANGLERARKAVNDLLPNVATAA
jgi:FMN-dependent NADH-azoreductase